MFDYSELPISLRGQHTKGVGEILTKLTLPMYSHLNGPELGGEISSVKAKKGGYKITAESIYKHDQNLRLDQLTDIFNRVDFTDIREWLDASPEIREVLDDSFSEHSKVDGLLRDFVQRRNDCNHGEVDDILSESQLIFFCNFISSLCEAIYEFSNHKILSIMKDNGFINIAGEVTEVYSNQISVALVDSGSYSIGSSVYYVKENYCKLATVESIKVDNLDCYGVSPVTELEVGFKTNIKPRKKSKIYCRES